MDIIFTHEFYKGKRKPRFKGDVSINLCKQQGEYKRLRFSFRQSAFDKQVLNPRYVQISNVLYSGPRLYFKFTSEPEGQCYTLSQQSSGNKSFWITPDGKEGRILMKKWVSTVYELQFDAGKNLFYIEQPNQVTPDDIAPIMSWMTGGDLA